MFSFRSRGGVEEELEIIILSEITEVYTPGGRKSTSFWNRILDKARAVKEWDIQKAAKFLNEHSSDLQEEKLPQLLRIICSSLPSEDTLRLLRSITGDDPQVMSGLLATRQPVGPDSDDENLISIFGDNEAAIPGLAKFLNEWRSSLPDDDFLTIAAIATGEWFTDDLEENPMLAQFVKQLTRSWTASDVGVFLAHLAVDNEEKWENETALPFFTAVSSEWNDEQKQAVLSTARDVWGWSTAKWDKLYQALYGKPFDRPPKKSAAAAAAAASGAAAGAAAGTSAKGVHQIPGVGDIAGGGAKKKKKKKKKKSAGAAEPAPAAGAGAAKPTAASAARGTARGARGGAGGGRAAPSPFAAARPAGDSDEVDEDDDGDLPDLDDLDEDELLRSAGMDPADMAEMLQDPAMLAQMMQMMMGGGGGGGGRGNPFMGMGMGGMPGGFGGFGPGADDDDDDEDDEEEAVPLRGGGARGGATRSRPRGGGGGTRGGRPRHRY